jgi:hypothetical protein
MNKTSKSEVYSWRLSSRLKRQLEQVARDEKTTVSAVLERIACDWLNERRPSRQDEEQRRLRKQLFNAIEKISAEEIPGAHIGSATNERVREVMGETLMKKYHKSHRRAPRRSA